MRFFALRHTIGFPADTEFLDLDPSILGDAPKCEVCGNPVGGRPWLPPRRARLDVWESSFGDVAFGPAYNLLVTERFELSWNEVGLVGLVGFEPVEIVKVIRHRRLKGEVPAYGHVVPARSRASVDVGASELEYRNDGKYCPVCQIGNVRGWKRIVFHPDTWSGEDVFVARGLPGTIFVSDRFREFRDEYGITNCPLIPAEEYSHIPEAWE